MDEKNESVWTLVEELRKENCFLQKKIGVANLNILKQKFSEALEETQLHPNVAIKFLNLNYQVEMITNSLRNELHFLNNELGPETANEFSCLEKSKDTRTSY